MACEQRGKERDKETDRKNWDWDKVMVLIAPLYIHTYTHTHNIHPSQWPRFGSEMVIIWRDHDPLSDILALPVFTKNLMSNRRTEEAWKRQRCRQIKSDGSIERKWGWTKTEPPSAIMNRIILTLRTNVSRRLSYYNNLMLQAYCAVTHICMRMKTPTCEYN